jgi:phage terminase Nu1 subunit (DNA packaging protein)
MNIKKLTAAEAAALLGISARQLNNLVNAQVLPRHGHHKTARYVWDEIREAYISYKIDQALPKHVSQDATSLAEADLRLKNATAELTELKSAKMRGEMVDIAYVERTQAKINANVRARILQRAAKLTPRLIGVTQRSKIKAIVDADTRETLNELVKIAAQIPDDEPSDEPTPAAKSKAKAAHAD